MTKSAAEPSNVSYLLGTTDCMLRVLDPYEESIRKYCSLRSSGAGSPEFVAIEKEVNERLAKVRDYQREANGVRRGFTIRGLHEVSTVGLNRAIRHIDRCIGKLPTDLVLPLEFDQPFQFWRKYLEDIRIEMVDSLNERGESVSVAQQHAVRVASQVQSYLETVRLLEERRDEDIANHPQHEEEIKRRYRKAIDALKDTA